MTLVFPRVRDRQKRRPKGRRFCLPLLRLTPVGIDPERIAGLLPAAPAVPRQTGSAQQGGSGIERHAERDQKKLLFSFFIHCSFLHLPRVRSATGAEVPNAVYILSG